MVLNPPSQIRLNLLIVNILRPLEKSAAEAAEAALNYLMFDTFVKSSANL